MSENSALKIDGQTIAKLARGVRLREDAARGQTILLAPERALALDEIAVAIVQALDGVKTLDDIAAGFALQFEAPKEEILNDVIAFIRDFASRRMLELSR
ncbi:pyrroloquinoline quinone biosynthesis peptide chaperone PqqD [Rhizobium sp. ICMP 5592]|uniref:pyrroloquinoline quinone biosynthesis peptide chaperone PqqD n=1 Tax=Rhizobium sp. ICMP 5592 TaxID=2292445 RepID=UPI001295BB8F|nr:pyrroloquinoline quinone biosynthesis peptide chaperone PqqD [Rhizobium sp. ICMP 5592]MQB44866.1 pyrroloquinoline quinone biosynthesis peptide chaperone PqqD [Rhizobium sp. ICMP 5592]